MNIIFLDIDGVLRTHASDLEWSRRLGVPIPENAFDRRFDPEISKRINEAAGYGRAKIVVTSTWRTKHSLEELKSIFRENGISAEVIGKTGIANSRGEEIEEWLAENDISSYVVIDDQVKDIVSSIPESRVIKADPAIGFADTDKAIDILCS